MLSIWLFANVLCSCMCNQENRLITWYHGSATDFSISSYRFSLILSLITSGLISQLTGKLREGSMRCVITNHTIRVAIMPIVLSPSFLLEWQGNFVSSLTVCTLVKHEKCCFIHPIRPGLVSPNLQHGIIFPFCSFWHVSLTISQSQQNVGIPSTVQVRLARKLIDQSPCQSTCQ